MDLAALIGHAPLVFNVAVLIFLALIRNDLRHVWRALERHETLLSKENDHG
jgi:hypothetical protein